MLDELAFFKLFIFIYFVGMFDNTALYLHYLPSTSVLRGLSKTLPLFKEETSSARQSPIISGFRIHQFISKTVQSDVVFTQLSHYK